MEFFDIGNGDGWVWSYKEVEFLYIVEVNLV